MRHARKVEPVMTPRQRLEDELEAQRARVRASFREGARDLTEQQRLLGIARQKLGHNIATELGHIAMCQGISFECPRCGDSGAFDVSAEGHIFTRKCGGAS